MNVKLAQKMLLVEAPLVMANIDPIVTCSDACETGGGSCFSTRLTWAEREAATSVIARK